MKGDGFGIIIFEEGRWSVDDFLFEEEVGIGEGIGCEVGGVIAVVRHFLEAIFITSYKLTDVSHLNYTLFINYCIINL